MLSISDIDILKKDQADQDSKLAIKKQGYNLSETVHKKQKNTSKIYLAALFR